MGQATSSIAIVTMNKATVVAIHYKLFILVSKYHFLSNEEH